MNIYGGEEVFRLDVTDICAMINFTLSESYFNEELPEIVLPDFRRLFESVE